MTRPPILAGALLLTFTSSLAAATISRHIAWDAVVAGKDGSKIRGPAEMVAGKTEGTTSVEVQYTGDTPGATRSWHVHIGSCAKGGAILGSAKSYPTLTVDAKGAVKGKATLSVALPEAGNYYVNIHESPTNLGKIVACGDLMLAD